MGSIRLPGKVMCDISGKPLIQHIIERLKRCNSVNTIVLLTSTNKENNVLEELAHTLNIFVHRGSEDNVLSRFVEAQKRYNAKYIIRICADNPLVDPVEVDRIVEHHIETGADYSFNAIPAMGNNYPDGVGAEIFNANALLYSAKYGISSDNTEHANKFILSHPHLFKIETIQAPENIAFPDVKLDVDTYEQLEYIRDIFRQFNGNLFATADVLSYVRKNDYRNTTT